LRISVPLSGKELGRLLAEAGLAPAGAVVLELGPEGTVLWTAEQAAPSQISPASLIKVPIAAALADRFKAGAMRPEDRVAIAAANVTANDGPAPFAAGAEAALADLAWAAIAWSDNTATNVLIDVLGRKNVEAFARRCGLTATHVRRKLTGAPPPVADPGATGRNCHPPADAARLFAAIAAWGGGHWLYRALAAQAWNEKLSAGLAPGDRFAHKTGDHDAACNDGGILETAAGRRFVVVAYCGAASAPAIDAAHGRFMRLLRPLLER
jgi:beta-lactamase class A